MVLRLLVQVRYQMKRLWLSKACISKKARDLQFLYGTIGGRARLALVQFSCHSSNGRNVAHFAYELPRALTMCHVSYTTLNNFYVTKWTKPKVKLVLFKTSPVF